jgi:hypothetical protein
MRGPTGIRNCSHENLEMNAAPFLDSIRTLSAAMYVASQSGPPDDMGKIEIVEDALRVLATLSTGDRYIDEAASSLRVSVRTSGIMGIPPRKPKAAQGFMEECKALEAALIGFSSDSN